MKTYQNIIESPIGPLTTEVDETGAVVCIWFSARPGECDPDRTREVDQQLAEYFEGRRREFDLRLAPKGTAFQKQVWAMLVQIPYGVTRSYGDLAKELGNPGASRAVGRANATNPIPIVVPCHRVIGTNGSLTGFAGGMDAKQWLLGHEGVGGTLF